MLQRPTVARVFVAADVRKRISTRQVLKILYTFATQESDETLQLKFHGLGVAHSAWRSVWKLLQFNIENENQAMHKKVSQI